MLRRRVIRTGVRAVPGSLATAHRWLSISSETRDALTQHLTALKDECKGQSLDLADMGDASKAAARSFQECVQRSSLDDPQLRGKIATLSASVKAYNTRLGNLQSEARSIQTEVDALLKRLWGTESPRGVSFANPPPSTAAASATPAAEAKSADDGFDVEPPAVARILDLEPGRVASVEQVEAERVSDDTKNPNAAGATKPAEEEIEVETIEIEVEPATGESKAARTEPEDPVDTMKITDITKELYERGVNFADCLDARSLRQRYRDVMHGKVSAGYPGQQAQQQRGSGSAYTQPLDTDGQGRSAGSSSSQPRMPPKSQGYQNQYQPPPPNTSDSGLAYDPYPNAQRKMVDPMKHVWEVKQEIAAEKGIDPSSVDMWSGRTKLEDHKRLYDYPSIQNYPIEVRQKGDVPR